MVSRPDHSYSTSSDGDEGDVGGLVDLVGFPANDGASEADMWTFWVTLSP